MKSIFNPQDNQEIINRIQTLTPSSKAKWGKMSVDQMLSHCQAPIDVAFGDLALQSNFFMQLLGKMLKNKILSSDNFKKDSPTAPNFIRKEAYNFEETRTALIQKVERFATEGTAVIKNPKHPFFGKMTFEEWDRLHYMHLNHHLEQFGA